MDDLRICHSSSRVGLTLASFALLLHSMLPLLVDEIDLLAVFKSLGERHLLLVLGLRVELKVAPLLADVLRGCVDVLIVVVIFLL